MTQAAEGSPGGRFDHLPKIELHCHLDAAVRVATVAEIGREVGLALPAPLEPALVAPPVCADLLDYISRIDLAIQVMQRPEHLHRVSLELVEDLAADSVVYAEVRFAPQLHCREGLTLAEVIDAVHAALVEGGRRHGVDTGLIVCCLRPQSAAESLAVARAAADRRDKVCGIDLAADESRPALPHRPAFELAREAGLRLTAHAGEAAGAASMREALDELKVERIGHGVRIVEDPALVEEVRAREVSLDMCPRSNVQTRAVASLLAHPADRLLKRGLRVTISTDGRTPSATTLNREFSLMEEAFGWGPAEFAACQENAARACFAPEPLKQRLVGRMRELPRA